MKGASNAPSDTANVSAEHWQSSTSGGPALLEVKQSTIIGGPVEGKVALLFDDMISTAGSICGAARLVHEAGAQGDSHRGNTRFARAVRRSRNFASAPIDSIVVTDSIPDPRRETASQPGPANRRAAVGRGDQADSPRSVDQRTLSRTVSTQTRMLPSLALKRDNVRQNFFSFVAVILLTASKVPVHSCTHVLRGATQCRHDR